MPVIHQHNSVLLPRLLSLKDFTPFLLVLDGPSQSADYFVLEFLHRISKDTNVILLSFETATPPERINHTIDCHDRSVSQVQSELSSKLSNTVKNVVLIDSLTYVPGESLSQFLISLMQRNTTIMAVYHTSLPTSNKPPSSNSYYPNPLSLLQYFATSCVTVSPTRVSDLVQEDRDKEMDKLMFPLGCNRPTFEAKLVHRRRSGRSIIAQYTISYKEHSIEYLVPKKEGEEDEDNEDTSLLENLTTFNLTTTEKQRQAKENVELPFHEAQEFGDGGAKGGAIIYQFEKDDDYDEEDPYEDPF